MMHLQDKMTATTTDKEAAKMAKAIILLPNTLFPLPIEKPNTSLPTITTETEERTQYQNALTEIELVFKRKMKQQKAQTVYTEEQIALAEVANLNTFTQTIALGFSADTQAVLSEMAFEYPTKFGDIMEEILSAIHRLLPNPQKAQTKVIKTGGAIWESNQRNAAAKGENPDHTDILYPRIESLGVADLRLIEKKLCCYETEEIAHIENVMQGEKKKGVPAN
jgi:hypothetical protein